MSDEILTCAVISLEDLRVLAESPNPNISNAAINIIISRFSRLANAGNLLNKDCTSKSGEVRKRARTAVQFLRNQGVSLRALPQSPPRSHRLSSVDSLSTVDDAPAGRTLSAAELARMLNGGAGGVEGGDAWVGQFVPSAADPIAGWTDVPRERPMEGDDEESERRRLRREAMVFHEGLEALRESDIIRPRG